MIFDHYLILLVTKQDSQGKQLKFIPIDEISSTVFVQDIFEADTLELKSGITVLTGWRKSTSSRDQT